MQYWAVESITADYGRFRYWLLAYAGQYLNANYDRRYDSAWDSYSLFDNNRGWMTSVRAGHNYRNQPSSLELFENKGTGTGMFATYGVHWYYDPTVGRFEFVGSSLATNCNCLDFGFPFSAANELAAVPCLVF